MTGFYDEMAEAAVAMIAEFGGTVTLRRIVLGDDDTDTGKPGRAETDYTAAGVKINYSADRVDGTLVQVGDQELLLSTLQLNGQPLPVPIMGDQIWISGARFAIKSIAKLEPTDVPVLFTLQLRGN